MDTSHCDSEQYRLQGVEVTGRSLGTGSNTDVVDVRYMGLTCAAKKFHFTKHSGYKSREKEYSRSYHEHCCLLGKLRHPNLVQFIGYYCEEDSLMPILVYECLHTTLASCIKNYGPLPDSINYSVLKDVAMALRYLHELTTPIAHRSLSASKVLLTRDMSAKLGDMGVASLTEVCQLSPAASCTEESVTHFVPQIVIRLSQDVELKNDIYSYGLLIIHTITGRTLLSEMASLEYAQSVSFCESDMVEVLLTEIHENHALLSLLEKCLATNPHTRPCAITILHKMAQVCANHPPLFTNSLEMLQQIKTDAESQLKRLTPQNSQELSQNDELDRLKELVRKISTQNIALQARLSSRSGSFSFENGTNPSKGLVRQDKQCISSPLQVSNLKYCL